MGTEKKESIRVALLTVSTRAARGDYEDGSGQLLQELLRKRTPWEISHYAILPDDPEMIAERLRRWAAEEVNLILTSGGTGFGPYDLTPEATRQVIEREAPGIAEALRAESLKVTQHGMLSRGVAGIRARTLIINLPGNPKAVKEGLDVLLPVLPHALALIMEVPHAERQHRTV